jgi:hypothetical protein
MIQTPKANYQVEEKLQFLYPPTAEITPEARRRVEGECAVLEAMAQSAASLPVTPYFGPMMFQGGDMPFAMRDSGDESFQLGTLLPAGMGWQIDGNGMDMEFSSLDEIISSMEGMAGVASVGADMQTVKGMEGGFTGGGAGGMGYELQDGLGFLDELGLLDSSMI